MICHNFVVPLLLPVSDATLAGLELNPTTPYMPNWSLTMPDSMVSYFNFLQGSELLDNSL